MRRAHARLRRGRAERARRAALPSHFPAARSRELQARLGLERVIVVQPNACGDHHRVTRHAIRALGAGAYGVGAVKPGTGEAEVERLTPCDTVAQRIFNLPYGAAPLARMGEVMALVRPFG